MSDITLNCGFGCSSVDGCQGRCDGPRTKQESENAEKTPSKSGGKPPEQLNVKAIVIG